MTKLWNKFWDWLFTLSYWRPDGLTCPRCYARTKIYPPAMREYCTECNWMDVKSSSSWLDGVRWSK